MTVRHLKNFIISLSLVCGLSASACAWVAPERWYMFEFDAPSYEKHYEDGNLGFWKQYRGGADPMYWVDLDEMSQVAQKKGDTAMVQYIKALNEYQTAAGSCLSESWSYPTKAEIAARDASLRNIIAECQSHRSGRYADRWLLLQMRANMLLRDYDANISLWKTCGADSAPGYIRDMMRNVYANALLNTGRKIEAWNIYADQNDSRSLVWSARKFTNLAGIKKLYREHPAASVHQYLLKKYVNAIQDVVDMYDDQLHRRAEDAEYYASTTLDENMAENLRYYLNDIYGDAFAPIDKDYMAEIKDFTAFADSVAHLPATGDPCLWESASALCAYFLGHHSLALARIDDAMRMNGSPRVKNMARRIRMLISCSAGDINSPQFKKYITSELSWLDSTIRTDGTPGARNARDRILNLGLAKRCEAAGDTRTARLIGIYRDYTNSDSAWRNSAMTAAICPLTSKEMTALFNTLDHPGDDPVKMMVAAKVRLSSDLRNDLLGTKLLQEGQWAAAIPYLEKVSMPYVNSRPTAFYAARRDYKVPAWNRFQSVGDRDYEATQQPQHLASNPKVDFCKYMLQLEDECKLATRAHREKIALAQATAMYQASRFGQCWYLSQYGYSAFEDKNIRPGELAGRAIMLLNDCATSKDPAVRAAALFGLAYCAPDEWMTESFDWYGGKYVRHVTLNPNSKQYAAYSALTALIAANPQLRASEISRCDIIRQFRCHAHPASPKSR